MLTDGGRHVKTAVARKAAWLRNNFRCWRTWADSYRAYFSSPLIRPPLASPRGIILPYNIQPSLTWRGPFAQRLGSGWAVRNFFCMGRVAPVQQGLKSREFRVAAGRVRYHAALSAYRTRPVVQERDTPMNGAAIIAEILRREGTEFLSCYPRNPLIEACAALDIRPILCRQERVGVGLADGYTRVKRGKRNGVFAAQAGPGIENAFPGVAQAFSENVPLLIIPAGLPLARQYVRPVFRAADVYRPVTKWSALAHSVQELPDLMRRAYHAMRSGKGGPVL